jgi:hypothetical protein
MRRRFSAGIRRRAMVALLAAAALPLQGCVGLVAVVRGSADVAIDRPLFRADDGSTPVVASADDLRRAWGDPRRQRVGVIEGSEWIYRCGPSWRGLGVLVLVVPLPLLLPIGFHEVRAEVIDGKVVAVRGDVAATVARAGCLWGPLALDDGPACGVRGRSAAVRELTCRGDGAFIADDERPHSAR